MGIKIIPQKDIYISQADYEHYRKEWENCMKYTVRQISFDVWLERRLKNKG